MRIFPIAGPQSAHTDGELCISLTVHIIWIHSIVYRFSYCIEKGYDKFPSQEKGKSIETERKSVVPGAEGRSELGVTA